ncbi:MAG: hypothetical protein AB1807_08565 [Pseudomonadota bacterium]
MSRILLYIVLGCAPAWGHAHADWDYSVSAQLAMYDAIEQRCGAYDRATIRKKYADMLWRLIPEERSELKTARQSAEYREVLAQTREEIARMIAGAGQDGEAKACKNLVQGI